MKIYLILALSTVVACNETAGRGRAASIGDVPEISRFSTTDCDVRNLADCSGRDADGRVYAVFDGAVSKISLTKLEAKPAANLPAGMVFGEHIDTAMNKSSKAFNIAFDRVETDGRVIYSSDFLIPSPSKVPYSLELVSDRNLRLDQVIERTDF